MYMISVPKYTSVLNMIILVDDSKAVDVTT